MSSWLPGWATANETAPEVCAESDRAVGVTTVGDDGPERSAADVVVMSCVGRSIDGKGTHWAAEGYEWLPLALGGVAPDRKRSRDQLEVVSREPPRYRWRKLVAAWDDDWRNKWGARLIELRDQGMKFPDYEERAFEEIKRERLNA